MNALVETARLNEIAHCHIMFHLHHRMQVEFAVPMRNRKTNRLEDFISRAVLFGGFLNYYREYCDIGAMDKTFVGTYRLLFCEDGKIRVQEEDF